MCDESPYEQGQSAVYDAINPYPEGTLEYEEWEQGWEDGDDD